MLIFKILTMGLAAKADSHSVHDQKNDVVLIHLGSHENSISRLDGACAGRGMSRSFALSTLLFLISQRSQMNTMARTSISNRAGSRFTGFVIIHHVGRGLQAQVLSNSNNTTLTWMCTVHRLISRESPALWTGFRTHHTAGNLIYGGFVTV
jgi:hypothetical protein